MRAPMAFYHCKNLLLLEAISGKIKLEDTCTLNYFDLDLDLDLTWTWSLTIKSVDFFHARGNFYINKIPSALAPMTSNDLTRAFFWPKYLAGS